MLYNTYLFGAAGVCSVDAELLDRLRLVQERLALIVERIAEDPAAAARDTEQPHARQPARRVDAGD